MSLQKGLSWAEAFARGLCTLPPLNSHEEATGFRGARAMVVDDDGTLQPAPRDPEELKAEAEMMRRRQAAMKPTLDRIARHKAQLREIGDN